jgi:hypothetical protein
MTIESSIRTRIDEVLRLKADAEAYEVVGEVYAATLGVAVQIYGAKSRQAETVAQLREDLNDSNWTQSAKQGFLVKQCHGILRSFASDLDAGRLGSLRLALQGQVFADFVNAAKAAQAAGAKDAAAVLACAALEDTLKRYSETQGLDVDDKEMSEVINALKRAGSVTATEGALMKGMVALRNKALHAEWDKVDAAAVSGVIAFVEEFLIRRFRTAG